MMVGRARGLAVMRLLIEGVGPLRTHRLGALGLCPPPLPVAIRLGEGGRPRCRLILVACRRLSCSFSRYRRLRRGGRALRHSLQCPVYTMGLCRLPELTKRAQFLRCSWSIFANARFLGAHS